MKRTQDNSATIRVGTSLAAVSGDGTWASDREELAELLNERFGPNTRPPSYLPATEIQAKAAARGLDGTVLALPEEEKPLPGEMN